MGPVRLVGQVPVENLRQGAGLIGGCMLGGTDETLQLLRCAELAS